MEALARRAIFAAEELKMRALSPGPHDAYYAGFQDQYSDD